MRSPPVATVYAPGRLVILWRDRKHHEIKELTENWVRFVALADPKLALYSVAPQQSLENENLWAKIQPKIAYAENARQTLQLFDW